MAKPEFRSGKGTPGKGGHKCPCCGTGLKKAKNRRILRHRAKRAVVEQIKRVFAESIAQVGRAETLRRLGLPESFTTFLDSPY